MTSFLTGAERPRGVFVGLTVLDILSRVQHAPAQNEKVTALRQDIAAGGPAANAAVTFAALGGDAVLVTALGEGAPSDLARADLESHGVRIIDCAPPSFALGVSSITVIDGNGDRSVVSTDGGSVVVELESNAAAAVSEGLAGAGVVLADGHHPEMLRAVLALVPSDIPVVVDAGRWKPQFEWILEPDRHIVASADFTDPHGWIPSDGSTPSGRLAGGVVVQTHGAGPIAWHAFGATGEVPAHSVRAVDTLGAGDAFHGGYAYGVALTGPGNIVENLGLAARVAATRVSHVGPRNWLKYLG